MADTHFGKSVFKELFPDLFFSTRLLGLIYSSTLKRFIRSISKYFVINLEIKELTEIESVPPKFSEKHDYMNLSGTRKRKLNYNIIKSTKNYQKTTLS